MAWLLIFLAGCLETVWAIALKQSDGFSQTGSTVIFVVAGIASVALLAVALRDVPVGTGYGVWTGIGAIGAAGGGVVLLGEEASLHRLAAVGLVATGILWLAFGD